MPRHASPRSPRRFPAFVLTAGLVLAGCAGVSGLDRARAMPPPEIARQSDEVVCERLRGFGYIADVPAHWLREARRRTLENCIDQGIARRENDNSTRGRQGCDQFAVVPIERCR